MVSAKYACNACTVRKSTVFSAITNAELQAISRVIQPCTFAKKEVIYFADDPMAFIYLVKNGMVKVYKGLQDGRQQTLRICRLGDVLGLDAVFLKLYPSSAEAITKSVLCRIRISDFKELLASDNSLALKMLMAASQELVDSHNQIFNLGTRTAKEKIADFLVQLYISQCSCEVNPRKVDLPVTRKEISELLGIKHETVVRILKQLKDAGLIRVTGREIALLKPVELEQLALCDTAR